MWPQLWLLNLGSCVVFLICRVSTNLVAATGCFVLGRKGKEVIKHSLGCTTWRLAQGLECLVGDANLRVAQLKIHKETSLNCPELLPC